MRDHVLLQAIARVNRPYEDESGLVKPYGFVLDFVGIFEKLETALAFDADVVASAIQNVDVLKELFATMMREPAPQYLPLARGWDDKAKERAIEHFQRTGPREAFFRFFKQIQNLYEILSPDAFLRPYVESYQKLAQLYALIRNAYSDRIYVDKELTAKTKELLRKHTDNEYLELPNAIHELGPDELAAMKQSDATDTTKILNLRKVLAVKVKEESGSKPFLLSIGERAEALAQAYENKIKDTQQVLAEFELLAQEYSEADAERNKLNIDENSFAIYTTLKPLVADLSAAQATVVNDLFNKFPDYRWSREQEMKLRTELYQALRPMVGAKMVSAANDLLKLQRV